MTQTLGRIRSLQHSRGCSASARPEYLIGEINTALSKAAQASPGGLPEDVLRQITAGTPLSDVTGVTHFLTSALCCTVSRGCRAKNTRSAKTPPHCLLTSGRHDFSGLRDQDELKKTV